MSDAMLHADDLSESDIDMLLERFDQTEPGLQRRIIAQFVIRGEHYRTQLESVTRERDEAITARDEERNAMAKLFIEHARNYKEKCNELDAARDRIAELT